MNLILTILSQAKYLDRSQNTFDKITEFSKGFLMHLIEFSLHHFISCEICLRFQPYVYISHADNGALSLWLHSVPRSILGSTIMSVQCSIIPILHLQFSLPSPPSVTDLRKQINKSCKIVFKKLWRWVGSGSQKIALEPVAVVSGTPTKKMPLSILT